MSNGNNDFGVTFSQIMFLEKILKLHENVQILGRRDDIVFEIARRHQGDMLTIVCLNEYSAGQEVIEQVLERWPQVNLIYVGGKWNKPTKEAEKFCDERGMGIHNAGTLAPALRK